MGEAGVNEGVALAPFWRTTPILRWQSSMNSEKLHPRLLITDAVGAQVLVREIRDSEWTG